MWAKIGLSPNQQEELLQVEGTSSHDSLAGLAITDIQLRMQCHKHIQLCLEVMGQCGNENTAATIDDSKDERISSVCDSRVTMNMMPDPPGPSYTISSDQEVKDFCDLITQNVKGEHNVYM